MDQTLRDLERRAASGDVEAEARLLLDRVRAGELSEEKLRLAAYLDYVPARVALGEKAQQQVEPQRNWLVRLFRRVRGPEPDPALDDWITGLDPFGLEVLVRTATATVALVLPWFERGWQRSDPRARDGVEALRAWIACPCEDHSMEADCAAADAHLAADWDTPNRSTELAARAVGFACQIIESEVPVAEAVSAVGEAVGLAGAGVVRQAVRAELVPWALGLGDPVRERVEARQEGS